MTEAEVAARLGRLHQDLRALDGDRARSALCRILGKITVLPLDGSWANGWDLQMQTRPWAAVSTGALQMFGCGCQ